MNPHHHGHQEQPVSKHHPRSAEHWEELYAGEARWSGKPNAALVAEVTGLPPGRALDLGCGEGADSVWLAQQGWQVTALDIAHNAVERTLAAATAAGVEVAGVVAPFDEADLPVASFDLVSALYPVVWKSAENTVERRLFELVAPGGTLLFVHHDRGENDPEGEDQHGPYHDDFGDVLMPTDIRAALPEGWNVVTEERRERHVTTGAGAGHTHDLILRAVRNS